MNQILLCGYGLEEINQRGYAAPVTMILKYYVHPYLIICLPKALTNKSFLKSNVFSIFSLAFGEFPFSFLQSGAL